jgi:hypothetical protein
MLIDQLVLGFFAIFATQLLVYLPLLMAVLMLVLLLIFPVRKEQLKLDVFVDQFPGMVCKPYSALYLIILA